jgi:hypothetical protein
MSDVMEDGEVVECGVVIWQSPAVVKASSRSSTDDDGDEDAGMVVVMVDFMAFELVQILSRPGLFVDGQKQSQNRMEIRTYPCQQENCERAL